MSTRRSIEQRSGPALVILGRAPKAVPFLLIAALLLAGLALRSTLGGILLLVLLAITSWVTYLAWPVLAAPARAIRVVVLVMIASSAAARF